MRLNINTDSVVRLTATLEKLHKSALPIAIRTSLNSAAFDVKQNTMPNEAGRAFIQRQKNFFKANSKVEQAQGFDISKMKSTVGFFENNLANKATNYAVKELEEQEVGGTITNKSFIAMSAARRGGTGLVKKEFRLSQIEKKIINAKRVNSVNSRHRKQKLIRAAIKAREVNGNEAYVLGNPTNGTQTLFKVQELWTGTRSANQTTASRKLMIKLIPIYRVKKGRAIQVKKTNFMQRASLGSAVKIENYYIKEAQKQISKYAKKL